MELFTACPAAGTPSAEVRERLFAGFRDLLEAGAVRSDLDKQTLARRFCQSDGAQHPVSLQSYVDQLLENVIPHSINMSSPRCLGHMTGVLPSFARPLIELVTLLNQNLVKQEASRTFSLLERQTLAMMHRLVYDFPASFYDEHVQNEGSTLGIMASGGTLANITALWVARNLRLGPSGDFPGVEAAGMSAALEHYGYSSAVIIASSLIHYSLEKAVSLLGLGARSLIKVPVDQRYRMDMRALRRAVADCASRRQLVIAVVGIAGTTDCGSIDPLDEVADLAQESAIYFHVDAAWGAPLLFSRRHSGLLRGLNRADSVTADGHKQMYLPIGSSMLLLRCPRSAAVIEKQTHYILHEGSGDLGKYSLEGSRGATSLYLHAALNVIGAQGYGFIVEENIQKTRLMADLIRRRPEFELLAEPETNILLYRYLPPESRAAARRGALSADEQFRIGEINKRIQNKQYEVGRAFVSRTALLDCPCADGRPLVALRAVVANPFTSEDDLKFVLDDQVRIAAGL